MNLNVNLESTVDTFNTNPCRIPINLSDDLVTFTLVRGGTPKDRELTFDRRLLLRILAIPDIK